MALTTAAKPIGSRFCTSPAQKRFLRRIVLHAFDSFLFFGKPEQKARAAAYLPHIKGKSYEYTRCKTRKTQIAAVFIRLIAVSVRPAYARTRRFARPQGAKNANSRCIYSAHCCLCAAIIPQFYRIFKGQFDRRRFYSRPYSRLEARFLANNGFFTTFFAQALDRREGLCYSMYDMNSCKIASFMQIYDHFQKRFERLSLRTGRSTAARG